MSAAKGHFIRDMGLKGFSMWESEGDYKNILLDSISKAAGIL
jgi:chitinase